MPTDITSAASPLLAEDVEGILEQAEPLLGVAHGHRYLPSLLVSE
jgi:hypothetical protein